MLTISYHVVAATFLQDFGIHVKEEDNGRVSHEPITSGGIRGQRVCRNEMSGETGVEMFK